VTDTRRHRGPHPEDRRLFAPDQVPRLVQATAELSWLLARRYSQAAAWKLVGDHHQLHRRQRLGILRCACPPEVATARRARRGPPRGRVVCDGFNVIVGVEAALAGGVLLRGIDGLYRDLASVHGTYRKVDETALAVDLLGGVLRGAEDVLWLLDRPVSNSGRVAALLREAGWETRLVDSADREAATLAEQGWAVATADGPLLDRVGPAVDLVGAVIEALDQVWVVDLGATTSTGSV